MAKLILLSALIALVALPVQAARDPHPARGMRRTLVMLVVFNFFYLFAVRVILPRIE